jgi:hypothetical protein
VDHTCGGRSVGGPDEAPEVSQISNMRPGLDEDLGLCIHRR